MALGICYAFETKMRTVTAELQSKRAVFQRACRGEATPRVPVWDDAAGGTLFAGVPGNPGEA